LRSVSKAECGSPSSFSMVAWPGGRGSRASRTFERKPGWEGALSLSPLTADSGSTNKRHARDAIPRRSRDPPLPQWRPNLPLEATLGLGPTPDLSGALLSLPGPRAPPPRRPQLGAAPLLPTAGTSGMKGRRKGTAGRAVSSFLVSSGRPAGRRALTSSESPGRRRTPRLRSATPPPPPPTPFVVTGSHSNRRRPTPVAPPPSRSVSAPPPYWPRPV
jgi:hypothetical protein